MSFAVIQFVFCGLVTVVAGVILTRCADALADLTGLGRLLIGSVLLAATTSLPELTVDISAVRMGLPDLAVGDLLGSGLFNLLILAVIDIQHPSSGRMLSRASAAHALSAVVSIALTAVVAMGILLGDKLPRWNLWGLDPVMLAILLLYGLGVRLIFYDQRVAAQSQVQGSPEVLMPAGPRMTLPGAIIGFTVATIVILLSGPYMADAAARIAHDSGLGATFVGSTLVAFSTSLPELVASLTAVRMGAFDLAVGNVFGSNAFNILLLVPLAMIHGDEPLLAALTPSHALTCLALIVVSCVAVAGQLYQVERRLRLVEPDAVAVILLVLGFLWLLYLTG